jgi:hypothetical protein
MAESPGGPQNEKLPLLLNPSDESDERNEGTGKPPEKSLAQLAFATISFFGCQFGWALQISQLTPFIQILGLPPLLSAVAWLCGPVTGFFVQPIVGVLSDSSTSKFGRRRPYIFAGACIISFSLLLIPSSVDIQGLLGGQRTAMFGELLDLIR